MNTNEPQSPSKRAGGNARESDASILLVYNQASMRMTMERYLVTHRIRAFSASSGREALDKDKANLPAGMVLDTALPDMTVEELLTKIRQHRNMIRDVIECYHARVMLVMAPNERTDVRSLRRLGVVDALPKPVNMEAFGRQVTRLLSDEAAKDVERVATIGILDPETRAREFFIRTLHADDVHIVPMTDVFDVYGSVADNPFDILLVETIGVGEDPLQFLRTLRERSPNTRVIVCTAFHDASLNSQFLDFGVSAVFTKPVNLLALRRKVREVIGEIHEPVHTP